MLIKKKNGQEMYPANVQSLYPANVLLPINILTTVLYLVASIVHKKDDLFALS